MTPTKPYAWAMRAVRVSHPTLARNEKNFQLDKSSRDKARMRLRVYAHHFTAEFNKTGLIQSIRPFNREPGNYESSHWEGCEKQHKYCRLRIAFDRATEVTDE